MSPYKKTDSRSISQLEATQALLISQLAKMQRLNKPASELKLLNWLTFIETAIRNKMASGDKRLLKDIFGVRMSDPKDEEGGAA